MPRRRPDALDALSKIFSGFQFSAPGAAGRVLEQLRPWVTELTLSAAANWLPRLALGIPCHVGTQGARGPVRCPSHAIGLCSLCQGPVCLRHAYVAVDGGVICFVCGAGTSPGQAAGEAPPGSPPGAGPDLREARQVLGVKATASWEEIQAAYKKKARKTHPDAGGSAEAFRRVQAAYEALRADHEKSRD